MNITYHQDPGHGWFEVSKQTLIDFGIADKITSYSYIRGDSVFLEEDCDAALFYQTARSMGIDIALKEVHHGDGCFIRGLRRYPSFS